jgi:hypothetical protein
MRNQPRYDGRSFADLKKSIDIARKYGMKGALGYVECVATARASSALFTTFTTAKTVLDPTALWTMPANYLYVGRKMRIRVAGAISNIVTTPGLMNFQIKIGSVAAFDTGNIQLNATAHTTLPFFLDISAVCQVVGSGTTAKLLGIGTAEGIMFTRTAGQTDDAQGMQTIVVPQTNPAQGTGFDSTIANIVDLWAGFTISNAGNGVRVDEYSLEFLN